MVDRTLAAAFIDNNVHHRILGRRLQPFSLWHKFLLLTVASPFLAGEMLKFWDMREAVGICSMNYPQCKVSRPLIVPIACFFLYGFPKKRWIKFLTKTKDRLLEYFGDYISRPQYNLWNPEPVHGSRIAPPPRLGPIPEVFSTLADVISFLNCSEEHAWNMPVGQAYWWQMACLKKAGEHINFLDEEERQFQSDMQAAESRKGAA